jgi:hypothetical protein
VIEPLAIQGNCAFRLVPKLLLGNALAGHSASRVEVAMTRSRYRIFETEYPYILTCTVVGWLPVFTRPEAVAILYDCWRFLRRERGFELYG